MHSERQQVNWLMVMDAQVGQPGFLPPVSLFLHCHTEILKNGCNLNHSGLIHLDLLYLDNTSSSLSKNQQPWGKYLCDPDIKLKVLRVLLHTSRSASSPFSILCNESTKLNPEAKYSDVRGRNRQILELTPLPLYLPLRQ